MKWTFKKVWFTSVAAATVMLLCSADTVSAAGSFGGSGGSWGSGGGSWGSGGSRGGSWGSGGSGGSVGTRLRSSYSSGWGSGGSGGSVGGSRGSVGGSRGGGLLSRLGSRLSSRRASGSGGSYGSYGSGGSSGWTTYSASYHSGGSGGSYGSYVPTVSYSSAGSSHIHYSSPVEYSSPVQYSSPIEYGTPIEHSAPIQYGTPINSGAPIDSGTPIEFGAPIDSGSAPPAMPRPEPEVDASGLDAVLNVMVPDDAIVYVNDKRTQTPGQNRKYVSRNLKAGFKYAYEVKAEVVRNGKTETQTKLVDLRAGHEKNLEFEFASAEPIVTSLTIRVPENAKVTLGGVETGATGSTRVFSTTKLPQGESWTDYKVSVTVEHEGRELAKSETVSINAGESVELDFVFDDIEVASR